MAAAATVKTVCINGRFLTQATTGVQRYAVEMVRALDRLLTAQPRLRSSYSFRLLTPRNGTRPVSLQHIPITPVGRLKGQIWEQVELPAHSGPNLILNFANTAPLRGMVLVTIHDASVFAVPEAYSVAFRLWYRTLLPTLGRRARMILTVSNFSRTELSRRARVPPEKIRVIPLGCEHVLRAPADCEVFSRVPVRPGGYILAVGSRSPHKNLDTAIQAVSVLGSSGLPLVAAGGANTRVFNPSRLNSEDSFHPAGYVSDAELRALYENAACFVYPSLYEGFGLPPLEAMICGCPAVVARSASLPEVCGDAALYCDPRDPRDLAQQIRRLLDSPAERAELRERGQAHARRFTWSASATSLLGLLEGMETQ
jgi:glycosyltransferase involved in cell wall biosynthesis